MAQFFCGQADKSVVLTTMYDAIFQTIPCGTQHCSYSEKQLVR